MNSITLTLLCILTFLIAYRFYATKIERIWDVDPNRPTPAVRNYDGVDYVPAKNWFILFGHHFSSIAGAGPIIGPIIALTLWGWVPALLWVVLGSILLGGTHDFGSLMVSIREEGSTIGEIAARSISRKAKLILSIFTWLALILVIAVFAYLGAKTFVTQPEVVIPSLGIIPLSILVGFSLYRAQWNSSIVTTISLFIIIVLIILGKKFPIVITMGDSQTFWVIVDRKSTRLNSSH